MKGNTSCQLGNNITVIKLYGVVPAFGLLTYLFRILKLVGTHNCLAVLIKPLKYLYNSFLDFRAEHYILNYPCKLLSNQLIPLFMPP